MCRKFWQIYWWVCILLIDIGQEKFGKSNTICRIYQLQIFPTYNNRFKPMWCILKKIKGCGKRHYINLYCFTKNWCFQSKCFFDTYMINICSVHLLSMYVHIDEMAKQVGIKTAFIVSIKFLGKKGWLCQPTYHYIVRMVFLFILVA